MTEYLFAKYPIDPADIAAAVAAYLIANPPSAGIGGSNTQVQFNDGGVLGGDAGLTYNKTTDTLTAGVYVATTLGNSPRYVFSGNTGSGMEDDTFNNVYIWANGVRNLKIASSGVTSATTFGFGSAPSPNTFVTSDAADTLALRNGTNTQRLNVYETFTDPSNYSRTSLFFSSGDGSWHLKASEAAGTGVSNRGFIIESGGKLDLLVGSGWNFNVTMQGTPRFAIDGTTFNITGTFAIFGTNQGTVHFQSAGGINWIFNDNTNNVTGLASTRSFGWSDTTFANGTYDVRLYREAAGILQLRNGTNNQNFKVYRTWTDASNGAWVNIGDWESNYAWIYNDVNGTGTQQGLVCCGVRAGSGTLFLRSNKAANGWGVSGGTNDKLAPDADGLANIGAAGQRVLNIHMKDSLTYQGTADANFITQNGSTFLRSGNSATSLVAEKTFAIAGNFLTINLDANDTVRHINFTSNAAVTQYTDLYAGAEYLEQRRGTNAQRFSVYNTFTSSSVYERFNVEWSSNTLLLRTSQVGATNRSISIRASAAAFGSTFSLDIGVNSFSVQDATNRAIISMDNTTITFPAGTTTQNPFKFTSGTNLTSAVAGAVEFDGVQFYQTIDTTSGRAAIPAEQYFQLSADGSTISTIANFFGSTSNPNLVSGAVYEIEIFMYFLCTTAGTVTWTLTNTAAPTNQNIEFDMSPITGIVAPPGDANMIAGQYSKDATAARSFTTGTLTTAVDHYAHFKILLHNSTGTKLSIQATKNVGGTITPRRGSYWRCRRLSTGNVGTFGS